jgi:lipoyl-dependent peroxiredoxin
MSDSDQRPRILYTAEATVSGGRRGHGVTSDGVVEVDFTSPKELGGDGARGTNPEQLFALGFAACWENAMLGIARRKGVDVEDATVTARVGIGRIESGRLGLAVELVITLPSLPDRAAAQALIDEAEQRCPYSNAVRGNVEVTLTLL